MNQPRFKRKLEVIQVEVMVHAVVVVVTVVLLYYRNLPLKHGAHNMQLCMRCYVRWADPEKSFGVVGGPDSVS